MTTFSTSIIYKALKLKLEEFFPDITIQIKDIKNIQRPCFYLRFITSRISGKTNKERFESFEIIYFAENFNLLELLEIKEKLEKLSNESILAENKFIEISEITINLNEEDYYLQANFDVEIAEIVKNSDTTDLMQVIKI